MSSIRLKFRASAITNKEGTLYFQVIHLRSVCKISSNFHIYPHEWNPGTESIIIKSTCPKRLEYLKTISIEIDSAIIAFNQIITNLQNGANTYSSSDICKYYTDWINKQSLHLFMSDIIMQLRYQMRFRTAETYASALKSFMQFRQNIDISITNLNSDIIESYQAYLRQRGLTLNTISFYMRILRAIYNRAVEKGLTIPKRPFQHVYTGVEHTIKRALSLKLIKQIINLNLSNHPNESFARDMFIFSFYTRGMSFIDMAFLKKSDLHDKILSYRRRKTGQRLVIKWEPCMQSIIDRYKQNSSQYLLPIISTESQDVRREYKNALFRVNRLLKNIAHKIGINTLSMYAARHSWASIAHSQNIPISIISEGMGHDSESTTKIYLASLDSSLIDKANQKILKSLL